MSQKLKSKQIKIFEITDVLSVKKPKWDLYIEEDQEGCISKIYTGYYPSNAPLRGYRWVGNKKIDDDVTWKKVEPFAFEGALRPGGAYRGRSAAGMCFQIDGLDGSVEVQIRGVEDLMRSICQGNHVMTNGSIRGLWYLHKGGQDVFVMPVVKEESGE